VSVSFYRGLGAPDESNDGGLEVNVFGWGVGENIDGGGGRGTGESQLEIQNNNLVSSFCISSVLNSYKIMNNHCIKTIS